MPSQAACFGESSLTLGTRIVFRYSVEICDQESVIFVHAYVHLGHPDFAEMQRKIFQRKGTFGVNLVSSNPLFEMAVPVVAARVPFVCKLLGGRRET